LAKIHAQLERPYEMKNLLLTIITTAAVLPLCTAAQADAHSSETTASDMYIGLSVGKGKHDFKWDNPSTEDYFDGDVTTMSFYVGKDFNETFAVEGFYTNAGESQIYVNSSNVWNIKGTAMGIAVKAGTNLSDDIRGFVKVGYHSWKSTTKGLEAGVVDNSKDDGTDVLYGLGVEYKLSDTTAVVAAYDRYTLDGDSYVNDMNIGIKYRF